MESFEGSIERRSTGGEKHIDWHDEAALEAALAEGASPEQAEFEAGIAPIGDPIHVEDPTEASKREAAVEREQITEGHVERSSEDEQ